MLAPPWAEGEDDFEIFGVSLEETRAFAAQALTRRLKVIGLVPAYGLDVPGMAAAGAAPCGDLVVGIWGRHELYVRSLAALLSDRGAKRARARGPR